MNKGRIIQLAIIALCLSGCPSAERAADMGTSAPDDAGQPGDAGARDQSVRDPVQDMALDGSSDLRIGDDLGPDLRADLDQGIDMGRWTGAGCPAALFRPEDFGAKINDGLDDAPALRDTIAAAIEAGGGVVELGAGEYLLGSSVNVYTTRQTVLPIMGRGITLRGQGSSSVLKLADGVEPNHIVLVLGQEDRAAGDVQIRDLVIDGNHPGNPNAPSTRAFYSIWASNLLVSDVEFRRAHVAVDAGKGTRGVLVRDVITRAWKSDGFEVAGTNIAQELDPQQIVFLRVQSLEHGNGNGFEIEDGAHGVSIIDSSVEQYAEIRNHAYPDAITRDVHVMRSSALLWKMFGHEQSSAREPLPVNWVEDVQFFNVEGKVRAQLRTRDVSAYVQAPISEGSARFEAGIQELTIAAPEASEGSQISWALEDCAGAQWPSLLEIIPGQGFRLELKRAPKRAVTLRWWLANAGELSDQ